MFRQIGCRIEDELRVHYVSLFMLNYIVIVYFRQNNPSYKNMSRGSNVKLTFIVAWTFFSINVECDKYPTKTQCSWCVSRDHGLSKIHKWLKGQMDEHNPHPHRVQETSMILFINHIYIVWSKWIITTLKRIYKI